jgi:predicted Zn finger-like uncharacterized protein
MKFLCPSCKAKYQIADDKVAGRSVRMKCRKCGYVIPISEIPPAPETKPPDEADWDAPPAPAVPKAPPTPTTLDDTDRVAPEKAVPKSSPLAASPPSGKGTGSAPQSAAKPLAAGRASPPNATSAETARKPALSDLSKAPNPPSAPGASPTPLTAGKPGMRPAVPGPRVAQAAPTTASKGPTPKPAPVSSAAKPAAASMSGALAAAAAPESTRGAPVSASAASAATASSAAGSSPNAAKARPNASAPADIAPPPPVAIAAGAAPATSGAFPPLPELEDADDEDDDATRIVKGGALADAFGALVGGSPSGAAQELGMPADEWFVGINDVPVGPIRLGEIRKRAVLGAISLESMVWRDGLEAWRPLKTFPELVAVLEESMSSVRASAAPLVRPAAGAPPPGRSDADSLVAGPSSGGNTGAGVVTDDVSAAGVPQTRMPVFAWLAILVALGFGVTIGFVLWSKQKPPEQIVKYVEVPAKPTATAITAAADPQAVETASPSPSSAGAKAHTKTHATDTATPDNKGGGLSGLKGLSALGTNGPGSTAASPGSTPVGGGGQLDAAQTQSTVARYTGSVKRSCWQPALDARDPNAPTSARVTVTITVGGTGNVTNVTTSGDPRGYPGLANCIGARVHAWQFPATGGTTTVNVPFVFAAQ